MYELNSELLDGYLHLVDISILRTPFIKDNLLKDKYSRGFRPQKLQMDRLSLAYSSDNSDLNNYLRKVVTGVMEQDVLKAFKKNEVALDAIDNIDDDFLKRFATASKDILTSDYYSQKCAAIFDFFSINYTQNQIDILDFIFRTNTVAALKKAEELDQCMENHKQEMAHIIKENQLEIQALTQERVELYENIKKHEEQIEILASELDETRKINQKHEERIRQFDQSQEYMNIQNPNVIISFCIYGTYIAPSNEQYIVAYRIADVYMNKLNPLNQPKVRYVKLDSLNRSKLTTGKCGIWEFAPPNTFGSEYSGVLNIYEIVFSNNEIKEYGDNYTLLGEQLGNGIEIDLDTILTEDFLLVIRELKDQYLAIVTNKRQWKQTGLKSKLTDYEHLYILATINKHLIFTQETDLIINGIEYTDRKLITHTNEGFSILKKVDLIFPNEVLKKAISKTKNIYDLTKSERQKMRNLIDEIFTRDEDRYKKLLEAIMIESQEYDKSREDLLISGLEVVEDKLNDWDEYFSLLIANHPKLYRTFVNLVEKEWQKANSDKIEAINEELKKQTAALTEAKEAYELAYTETKYLEEQRSNIAAQIETMNDDICDAVEKASSDAVKVIANNVILNALCIHASQGGEHTQNEYIVTKADDNCPCITEDDGLDNVVLDNLELYKYCDNGNDTLCISLLIAALYSDTIPIVISSRYKTICDCISIAIYGVPCSIINFPTATSKILKHTDLQNLVAEKGLVLLRGVLGGINETHILDIIRGEDGRDFANRILIGCEAAEELKYVPKWFFNYVIGIDMETCRLSKKTEGSFYTASDPTVTNENANSEKNALALINSLKKVFPEIIPQLNARVSVIEIANGIEEQLPVCKAIIKYDLLPILRSIGIDDDEAITRIKSARFSNFSVEELLARLEADD